MRSTEFTAAANDPPGGEAEGQGDARPAAGPGPSPRRQRPKRFPPCSACSCRQVIRLAGPVMHPRSSCQAGCRVQAGKGSQGLSPRIVNGKEGENELLIQVLGEQRVRSIDCLCNGCDQRVESDQSIPEPVKFWFFAYTSDPDVAIESSGAEILHSHSMGCRVILERSPWRLR